MSDNTESSEPSDEEYDDEQGSTDSPARRYWLTNDAIAIALVASLIVGVIFGGVGWLNLQTVPKEITLVYSASVGTAIVWAFGADAVEAWRGGD